MQVIIFFGDFLHCNVKKLINTYKKNGNILIEIYVISRKFHSLILKNSMAIAPARPKNAWPCRQCNAMQYNAMQYNAMQCNTMQCNAIKLKYFTSL